MQKLQAPVSSKEKTKEGDQEDRLKYERQMLVNPQTNQIPDGIREAELIFANSEKAHLKPNPTARNRNSRLVNEPVFIQRGPYNVGGRTRALAIDRTNENVFLAGGVSGGICGEVMMQVKPG